jgi:hypothetical protein
MISPCQLPTQYCIYKKYKDMFICYKYKSSSFFIYLSIGPFERFSKIYNSTFLKRCFIITYIIISFKDPVCFVINIVTVCIYFLMRLFKVAAGKPILATVHSSRSTFHFVVNVQTDSVLAGRYDSATAG